MQFETRDHVPLLTAILSIVALGLVFSAVLGVVPSWLLPRSELLLGIIPHLNAVISLAAIGTIIGGWRAIRRGDVSTHRRRMLVAFGLFTTTLFGLPDDPVVAHISLFGLVSALLITGAGPYSVDAWLAERVRTAAAVAKRQTTPGEQEPVEEPATDD